jgi:Tol biopolymer transport system component/tRNA A-37 threonylcarbamoyl transferase component Bud32
MVRLLWFGGGANPSPATRPYGARGQWDGLPRGRCTIVEVIGNKLAHYTITRKLGEGGMGVVYEAIDSHLDRAVALKLLPHDALADPTRKQRFVQEAKAASALNHPHIVTIYDIATADGVDYIAMELIRGRTLEQALSRGRLRLAEALKFGVQMADAVAAAHAAGIVHRDLKPGNVMITERGEVKLLDFGLAKLTEPGDVSEEDETRTARAITEEGSIVGSAPYMSPEQAEGRKVDARSDIFSFGAVLYEMLTGKRAFGRANRVATIAAVLKDEPESPSSIVPGLPVEVERVVTRCLRKDLARRSQSMAEIRIAIQDLKDESGSVGSQVALPVRKRRRLPYYVAGGLLLAAAIAVLFRSQLQTPAPPLHATILTSFVGEHGEPSLSPDGNQFAFTWDGDVPKGKPHVYISLVGKGAPLRLTPESESDHTPSWSPDGQSIAFVRDRDAGTSELEIMSALGGPARRVASGVLGDPASWSPDSRWLIWSQRDATPTFSIRIAPAAGGDPRRLVDPGASKADGEPAVSPNERQIVFSRVFADFDSDLFVANFHDGQITGASRRITFNHRSKGNPIWTADGKEVLYIEGDPLSKRSIFRIAVTGGSPRPIEGIGANAYSLTFSSKTNRLLYSTASTNYDIQRLDLSAAEAKAERFLSSTRFESDPSYSPDGKRIAFDSDRGGGHQIWVADADGSNPAALTSFASGLAGSPKWSPDGQFLVFDARPESGADIYTVPASGGPVKRLTDYPGEDHDPSWSPDGNWIYFGSRRAGGHEIFRMRTDGSGVRQITHNGGIFGMVTPDGKWLYYSASRKGLWKMPPDGGDATQVLPREALYGVLSFTLTPQGTYAIGKRGVEEYPIVFYPFDAGKPRTIAVSSRPPYLNPAVSPDGRYLLYTIADDPVYEIMLVDNFR